MFFTAVLIGVGIAEHLADFCFNPNGQSIISNSCLYALGLQLKCFFVMLKHSKTQYKEANCTLTPLLEKSKRIIDLTAAIICVGCGLTEAP